MSLIHESLQSRHAEACAGESAGELATGSRHAPRPRGRCTRRGLDPHREVKPVLNDDSVYCHDQDEEEEHLHATRYFKPTLSLNHDGPSNDTSVRWRIASPRLDLGWKLCGAVGTWQQMQRTSFVSFADAFCRFVAPPVTLDRG